MNWHKGNLQGQEEYQRQLNFERRNANRDGINSHKNKVFSNNSAIRQDLKNQSNALANARFQANYEDQENKVYKATHGLNVYKNQNSNAYNNRKNYNSSVSQAHNDQAAEHERIRQANE